MGKCEKLIAEIAILSSLYAGDLAEARAYTVIDPKAGKVRFKEADETYRRLEKAI